MQTRQRHVVCMDTVESLQKRKNGNSWRELASSLGYAPGYAGALRRIKNGEAGVLTRTSENILRERLGLLPVSVIEVPPCPDCGSVHVGRCHGLPVASVVVLQPGDTVQHNGNGAEPTHKPAKPRAPSKDIRVKPETHGRLSLLKEGGQTWNDLQNEMARVYEEYKRGLTHGSNA